MKNNGFSLLEMMIVLSIVFIILAIGVLHYAKQKGNNYVGVAEQIIAMDLMLTKDVASTSTNGAEIDLGVTVPGGNGVIIKVNGAAVRQDSFPPQTTVQTSWGNNAIVFNQNGSTGSFATNGIITVGNSASPLTKQIQVVPSSGAILQ